MKNCVSCKKLKTLLSKDNELTQEQICGNCIRYKMAINFDVWDSMMEGSKMHEEFKKNDLFELAEGDQKGDGSK